MSDTDIKNVPQIYGLIPKIMLQIGGVSKDFKNEAQGYKFRGIEQFYKAAHPAFIAHGVFCCPQVISHESSERVTSNAQGYPRATFRVVLRVSHTFFAPDGSSIEVITCGEGIDTSDKATNKAMSAAMKYAFIELFCIPTQDLDDADRTSPELGAKTSPTEATQESVTFLKKAAVTADGHITSDQAQKLHRRFRESLREDLKGNAEILLHEFLNLSGYKRDDGTASALMITSKLFPEVGKAAIEHARGL